MFMLRLVDVPKALEGRGYEPQEEGKQLVLSVHDNDSAPWNTGTWELTCAGENVNVAATSRKPDLTLGERTLAAVYSG
jgi:predicted acetyltransferase